MSWKVICTTYIHIVQICMHLIYIDNICKYKLKKQPLTTPFTNAIELYVKIRWNYYISISQPDIYD